MSARSIVLIVLGAAGGVLFICAAAVIFYRNTQRLIDSRLLEEHSYEVLGHLQTVSARLERMDYITRIYLAERGRDDKDTVRQTQAVIDSDMSDIEKLLWDPAQRNRARAAHVCAGELTQEVNDLLASNQTSPDERASLTRKMLACRNLVDHMQLEEEILMKQRTTEAAGRAYRNLLAGSLFLAVSLFTLLTLFGLLLRDVAKQAETERKIFDANERLKAMVLELRKQAAETSLIVSLREEMQLCTTPQEAHRTTVRHVARALPNARIALMIIDNERKTMELAVTSDNETQILGEFPISSCCGLRVGRARRRRAGDSEIECGHFVNKPPEDYVCVPLVAYGETLGLLYVGCKGEESSQELDLSHEILERISEVASMWIASLNLRIQLENQSIRDGLTSLYNRRFMEMALDREVSLAIRRSTDLSILMMDIDHFKRFNDTFGHDAGDQVLRGVAEILRDGVRAEDIACRYGGEELLLILPGTGPEIARQRAEDIRQRVNEMQLDLPGDGSKQVTISIGVAAFPQAAQSSEDLVRSADRALYAAKTNGRNRVEVAESVVPV